MNGEPMFPIKMKHIGKIDAIRIVQVIGYSARRVSCGLLLMSEETSDRLFRQIADTWLGSVEGDPLGAYVCKPYRVPGSTQQCIYGWA